MTRPFRALLLCFLQHGLLISIAALEDEFAGFSHFKGWDGDLVPLPWDTTGMSFGTPTRKGLCNAETACHTFTPRAVGGFRSMPSETGYDTYLAWNKTAAPGAACEIQSGGCTDPASKWLSCPGGDWFNSRIIATYILPPEQLHEACVNNKECLGFRARENRTAGDLFGNNHPVPGWFRLPQ
jgi:hypothetical protein